MAIRPPSLRAIAAFEAAARLGTFAKAAEELNLTQSAVSHAIRTLEARLEARLFERRGGMLEITADGVALAGRVRRSLNLLNEAFDTTSAHQHRTLVVSALWSFAEAQLAPRLSDFLARNSDVAIELNSSSRLVDLRGGEADIGIRFGAGQWPGLSATLLVRERLYPVVSPHYRGGHLPETPADLTAWDLIAHPDMPWALWWEAAGRAPPGEGRASLQVDSMPLALAAAAGGAGVALARDKVASRLIERGALVRLFDVEIVDDYSYWAVWDGGSPKIGLIRRFVTWLEGEFASLAEPGAGRRD